MKNYLVLILITATGLFCWFGSAWAGFGISPPDIVNQYLTPGSSFEEIIYLVRGDPNEDIRAEVTIDPSPIQDWITIENGMNFTLPAGEQQVPMKVIINVPPDAPYGKYKGVIRVRAISSAPKEGQVTTVLGGAIDVDLIVTEEVFSDFRVKTIGVPHVEKGSPVVVLVNLENLGNIKTRPSRIHLEIYDLSHTKLLRSADIFKIKGWVEPFQTGQVRGELAINLDLGEYWADVWVYKGQKQTGFAKVHFRVIPPKKKVTVSPEKFYLSLLTPLNIATIVLVVLIVIVAFVLIWRKKPRKQESKEKNNKEHVNR